MGNFRSGSPIRLRTKDRATLVVPRQEFSSAKRRKIIFFFPGRVSLSKTVERTPRPLNSVEKKSAAHPVLTLAPLFTRKFQSFRHHGLQEALSRDTLKSRRKKNSGLHCIPHLVWNRCGSPIAQKKKKTGRASKDGRCVYHIVYTFAHLRNLEGAPWLKGRATYRGICVLCLWFMIS